jgi:hypothetical protein
VAGDAMPDPARLVDPRRAAATALGEVPLARDRDGVRRRLLAG